MHEFVRVRMIGGTMASSSINSECKKHSPAELDGTSYAILEDMRVSGETRHFTRATISPLRGTSVQGTGGQPRAKGRMGGRNRVGLVTDPGLLPHPP